MTGFISALGSYSRGIRYIFKILVAAALAASAFIVSPSYAAEMKVQVLGMEPWLADIAERSLNAVVENISLGKAPGSVEQVVRVVSERLFSGYTVSSVDTRGEVLSLFFESSPPPEWILELYPPALPYPVSGWFTEDFNKSSDVIQSLLKYLPIEALSWCDEGLREAISRELRPTLKGWRPSLVVRTDNDRAVLQISFVQELPLVVAITPSFYSTSLPTLFYDELKNDVFERVSIFIGLPVEWAALHTEKINLWVEDYLTDKNLIKKTNSKVVVAFSPAPVSLTNIRVESSRYSLWGWTSVYAGTSDRSAELGVHIGRKAVLFPRSEVELYAEAIMELQRWSVEGRFGLRFMPWGDVWLGGEYSTDDEMWWARVGVTPRLHKPYAWLRLREDSEVNAAVGWKATEFISFEVHYDSRDEDSWSLRILGNL